MDNKNKNKCDPSDCKVFQGLGTTLSNALLADLQDYSVDAIPSKEEDWIVTTKAKTIRSSEINSPDSDVDLDKTFRNASPSEENHRNCRADPRLTTDDGLGLTFTNTSHEESQTGTIPRKNLKDTQQKTPTDNTKPPFPTPTTSSQLQPKGSKSKSNKVKEKGHTSTYHLAFTPSGPLPQETQIQLPSPTNPHRQSKSLALPNYQTSSTPSTSIPQEKLLEIQGKIKVTPSNPIENCLNCLITFCSEVNIFQDEIKYYYQNTKYLPVELVFPMFLSNLQHPSSMKPGHLQGMLSGVVTGINYKNQEVVKNQEKLLNGLLIKHKKLLDEKDDSINTLTSILNSTRLTNENLTKPVEALTKQFQALMTAIKEEGKEMEKERYTKTCETLQPFYTDASSSQKCDSLQRPKKRPRPDREAPSLSGELTNIRIGPLRYNGLDLQLKRNADNHSIWKSIADLSIPIQENNIRRMAILGGENVANLYNLHKPTINKEWHALIKQHYKSQDSSSMMTD